MCACAALAGDPAPIPDRLALWLVVPVKPLAEGKSRLAGVIPAAARADLSRRWLTHLLQTAQQWGGFAGVAVVSRDPAVWALAQTFGAQPIVERGVARGDDLNQALAQAQAVALAAGAEAVLVLPADLPCLTVADLAALDRLAAAGPGVVIAPAHDAGTNALLLRPPGAIAYHFGEGSFAAHVAAATAAHLPCRVVRSKTLALDIDLPEDLLILNPSSS
jgi:2-phospho-L-lactate guanylyltransferase